MIDGIAMKGKWIIITFMLQDQILEQLYSNQMGIEKTRVLARKSVYWGQYECSHKKYCEAVCYMPGVSADTAIRQGDALWIAV